MSYRLRVYKEYLEVQLAKNDRQLKDIERRIKEVERERDEALEGIRRERETDPPGVAGNKVSH